MRQKELDDALMRAFTKAVQAIPAQFTRPEPAEEEVFEEDLDTADRMMRAYEDEGFRGAIRIFDGVESLEGRIAALRPLLSRYPTLGLDLMANFTVNDAEWMDLRQQMEAASRRRRGRELTETAHFALPARPEATFPALIQWGTSYADGKHHNYSYRLPDGLTYYIFQTNNGHGRHIGYTLSRTNQTGTPMRVPGLWAEILENGDEVPTGQQQVLYASPQKAHAAARKHFQWGDRRPKVDALPARKAEAIELDPLPARDGRQERLWAAIPAAFRGRVRVSPFEQGIVVKSSNFTPFEVDQLARALSVGWEVRPRDQVGRALVRLEDDGVPVVLWVLPKAPVVDSLPARPPSKNPLVEAADRALDRAHTRARYRS